MLVAIVALVVALSGTAVAASTLVSGDSLIKKHSLSGNRLKNRTVTGRQIKISSLSAVPSAKAAPISKVTYVSATVSVANNGARPSATATCPSGTTVLGGGASIGDVKNSSVHQSAPTGKTGWTAVFSEGGTPTSVTTGTVTAICAPAAATTP
jgi:hypothetical protein